jgi:type I restriction enzyme S subunit
MRDEWVETTLGDVAELVIGRTPPRKEAKFWTEDLGHPFCTIADLDGRVVVPRREGVTEAAIQSGKAKRVPAGSLLMSFKLTIGRIAFAGVDLYPNEAIVWIEPNREVDRRFLGLWLESQDLEEYAGRAVKGRTLNGPSLRAIPVAVPPLAEQRRIVDLIAAVDENLAAAERYRAAVTGSLVAAARDLLRSGAPLRPLGEVAEIRAVLVDPTAPAYRDLPHVGVERIVSMEGTFGDLVTAAEDRVTSAKFHFGPEDIIYSKIRPELRKVAWPGFQGLCSADAYPLRALPPCSPSYLYELLLSEPFSEQAVARSGRTKMPKINRRELFSIEVEVPSPDVQEQAVSVLGGLRHLKSCIDDSIASMQRVRGGLLADLLSGAHEIPETYDPFLEAS